MRPSRLIAGLVAAIAGLLALPSAAPAAATTVGPLVLSGAQTIQTEGADVRGWSTSGGSNGAPQELRVTKLTDSASPKLAKAAALGTHFQQATLVWTGGGITQSLCLRDVLVSSFATGQADASTTTDTVALRFAQIAFDPGGTAACSKLGPALRATVTTSLRGSTLMARVACLTTRCTGQVSLQLPPGACARSSGIMPPDRACAGRPVTLGRVALADGSVRTLRLTVRGGRLRRALTRLAGGATNGIIAVLRPGAAGRPPGPPIRLRTFTAGRPVTLPAGLPAVQSAPGPVPATGTPAPPAGTPAPPSGTSLVITTCGPVGAFPRQFAGTITPPVGGLTITMTYTPPAGATITQAVTTTATGAFSDSVAAMTPGTWSAQASFGGTPAYTPSLSPACEFQGG